MGAKELFLVNPILGTSIRDDDNLPAAPTTIHTDLSLERFIQKEKLFDARHISIWYDLKGMLKRFYAVVDKCLLHDHKFFYRPNTCAETVWSSDHPDLKSEVFKVDPHSGEL